MKKDVKIIIADLDNTLLKNDKSISQYSQEIIKKSKDQGILFGIATARAVITAKEYIDMLRPEIEIYHGGVITRNSGRLFAENIISQDTTSALLYELEKSGAAESISVHTSEGYFTNSKKNKPYNDDYSTFFYCDFEHPFIKPAHKIAVVYKDGDAVSRIARKYIDTDITFYRDSEIATIALKKATKQNAIEDLLNALNIESKNTAAFGDDYTDIGMLEYCGLGVAVENAIQPVKDAADDVCGSNEEDGVARYIEVMILT